MFFAKFPNTASVPPRFCSSSPPTLRALVIILPTAATVTILPSDERSPPPIPLPAFSPASRLSPLIASEMFLPTPLAEGTICTYAFANSVAIITSFPLFQAVFLFLSRSPRQMNTHLYLCLSAPHKGRLITVSVCCVPFLRLLF